MTGPRRGSGAVQPLTRCARPGCTHPVLLHDRAGCRRIGCDCPAVVEPDEATR